MMMVGKRSVHSRAYAQKNKHRSKILLAVGCIVVVLLILASWWVTDKSPLVISSVTIDGANNTSAEEIERIVREKLDTRFLIWSRGNFILASRDDIESRIEETFDRVRRADVEVKGVSRVHVVVDEYAVAYTYCDVTQTDRCFFVDATGLVFAPDIYGISVETILFEENIPTGEDVVGEHILPKAEFANVIDFVKGLKDNDLHVGKVRLGGEGETRFTLTEGAEVIIDRTEQVEKMLGNFLLLLAEETVVNESREAFLSQTEYIDVRYGNKVFYKTNE